MGADDTASAQALRLALRHPPVVGAHERRHELRVVGALEELRVGDVALAGAAAQLLDGGVAALIAPGLQLLHRQPRGAARGAGEPKPS